MYVEEDYVNSKLFIYQIFCSSMRSVYLCAHKTN